MRFEFIADRPVLDFVATVSERGTSDDERLRAPADLAQWVAQSGLVKGDVMITQKQLGDAVVLRDAMFGLIASILNGTEPRPTDRDLVNTAAARPGPVLELTADGHLHRRGDLDAVLAVMARDCLDLFDSPDRDALQWCADARCTRAFIDRSRGHRRRWCGMKGCGDRAKAAAYRRRLKDLASAGT